MTLEIQPKTTRLMELYEIVNQQEKARQIILEDIQLAEDNLHNNIEPELIENYEDLLSEILKRSGGVANLFNMLDGKSVYGD